MGWFPAAAGITFIPGMFSHPSTSASIHCFLPSSGETEILLISAS
jgi:hypothetical protein